MKGPLFYSKILLFGEYGIIKNSKGLSIPYNFFKGALKTDENLSESAVKSNSYLKSFVEYLEEISKNKPNAAHDLQVLMIHTHSHTCSRY